MRRCSADSLARTAALIAVGAFVVHQLRYLAGYGDAAGSELSRQGHGYLAGAMPILAAFLISAVAAGLLRAALGRVSVSGRQPAGHRADTLARRAALFTAGIVVVFCVQESLEGVLCAGHAGGVAAVLAGGGWLAFPLAPLVATLCALLDRGIETLEIAVGRERGARRQRLPTQAERRPRQALLVPLSAAPLAFGVARRPPPAHSYS